MAERRYHLKNIRGFLTKGFSDQELWQLCSDVPELEAVCEQLAANSPKQEIINKLLTFVKQQLLMETLLEEARKRNPARYRFHGPYVIEPETPETPKSRADQLFESGVRAQIRGDLWEAKRYFEMVLKENEHYPQVRRQLAEVEEELRRSPWTEPMIEDNEVPEVFTPGPSRHPKISWVVIAAVIVGLVIISVIVGWQMSIFGKATTTVIAVGPEGTEEPTVTYTPKPTLTIEPTTEPTATATQEPTVELDLVGEIGVPPKCLPNCVEAELIRENLFGVNLRGANLRKANLWGTDLRKADLRGADLSDAILNQVDLRGTQIDEGTRIAAKWRLVWKLVNEGGTGASLYGVNLSNANLKGINLSGADFSGANLSFANLRLVNLNSANLRTANIDHTDFSGALYDEETQWPEGFDPEAARVVRE